MIECGSCGTDAVVLDRSGGEDSEGVSSEELVVLCAECAPDEITALLEAVLLEGANGIDAVPLAKSAHARAA
ncbi:MULTISPECIES: hypothetical protein [unclassified Rathayibacter]|uniref:hypothetical protein n=1 Tax=unclassified Rathayibacter TaxID=2609250 RepID=UPI001FB35EE1|nr:MULTISPECIES: hypothetical protein [unclassified Rathayibacter]MCJ1685139.1 hypothetical protein [Rathayibacter sp. VKM Ac-2928]MCJ1688946.1 hypothetical protein [Rathayibacter sp. VKM Ac-2927]